MLSDYTLLVCTEWVCKLHTTFVVIVNLHQQHPAPGAPRNNNDRCFGFKPINVGYRIYRTLALLYVVSVNPPFKVLKHNQVASNLEYTSFLGPTRYTYFAWIFCL